MDIWIIVAPIVFLCFMQFLVIINYSSLYRSATRREKSYKHMLDEYQNIIVPSKNKSMENYKIASKKWQEAYESAKRRAELCEECYHSVVPDSSKSNTNITFGFNNIDTYKVSSSDDQYKNLDEVNDK